MLRYNLLFIHIIAAMGMFAALGIEALALAQLRRASDSATAHAALTALGLGRRVGGISMPVLALTGLGLATRYWHWQGAWIGMGLVGLISIGAVGGLMTGRRVRRLQKSLGDDGLHTALIGAVPGLRTAFVVRAALLTGVVYLMTVKPGPSLSFGALGTAVVVGVVLSRARSRPETLHATRTTR